MTDDLRKEPDDRGTRRKAPRGDAVKRTRSPKEKSGASDRGTSERVVKTDQMSGQTSGKESALTTTSQSVVQPSPSGEPKRSPVKAGADSRPRTGNSADAATREASTPAGQHHERIARRAYALYEASGYRGEDALQHWLEAERELRQYKNDSARET